MMNVFLQSKDKLKFEITDPKEGDVFSFYVVAENSKGKSQKSNIKQLTFQSKSEKQHQAVHIPK